MQPIQVGLALDDFWGNTYVAKVDGETRTIKLYGYEEALLRDLKWAGRFLSVHISNSRDRV